jgi:hypothetical protein
VPPVTALEDLVSHIIKVRFEAYLPRDSEPAAVPFDFWVDDVYLLDQDKWNEVCLSSAVEIPALP